MARTPSLPAPPSRSSAGREPHHGPGPATLPGAAGLPARSEGPPRDGGGRFRGLRWRLALIYAGMLTAILLVLGVGLNFAISSVMYAEELTRFESEAKAQVEIGQRNYERLVNGAPADCAGAISYQQAFAQEIAAPLQTTFPSITSVYLLDQSGAVLAPEDAAVAVGERGPALQTAPLLKLAADVRAHPSPGPGFLAAQTYRTSDAGGQRIGVVLIAERYRTINRCLRATSSAIGIVQVITDFSGIRATLARVQLLLLLILLGGLVVGMAVGEPLLAGALRPLTRMTRAARRIAAGDLTQRVRLPHGGDEIGQLAETFDEMIARIEQAFAAQHASEERVRQFVADASHELRTPLTSIRGYIDVLLRGAKDDPETAREVLVATRREAERMSRLVNDLLTLARLDAGRPLELRQIDLIALVGEAVDQARILAGDREVALGTDGGGRLPVYADADRLKQVLLALLDNALKYGRTDAGGWVRVRVGRSERGAFVSVSDNGEGIAAEDVPHIFERFYRVQRAAQRRITSAHAAARLGGPGTMPDVTPHDSARATGRREGSGLGLAIARAIVSAHGGALSVQSQLGAGTTFTVELPVAPPA